MLTYKIIKSSYITFLLLFINTIYSQESNQLDGIIESIGNNNLKFYLDEGFGLSHNECATYYLISKLDKKSFKINDTLQIFYKNGSSFTTLFLKEKKFDGDFESYHENGRIKMKFHYKNGERNGVWELYTQGGNLIKKVIYNNGGEFLVEYFDLQQNQLVTNGNGTFKDHILMGNSSPYVINVNGKVRDGLPDGEWYFSVNEKIFAKEYYNNFIFQKGISISSVIGNKEYYDHFNAAFIGALKFENLTFNSLNSCNPKGPFSIDYNFFNKLEKNFYWKKLHKSVKENWFIIKTEINNDGKMETVNILSNADYEINTKIKEWILKTTRSFNLPKKGISNLDFFILVVNDSKLYISTVPETQLIEMKKSIFFE